MTEENKIRNINELNNVDSSKTSFTKQEKVQSFSRIPYFPKNLSNNNIIKSESSTTLKIKDPKIIQKKSKRKITNHPNYSTDEQCFAFLVQKNAKNKIITIRKLRENMGIGWERAKRLINNFTSDTDKYSHLINLDISDRLKKRKQQLKRMNKDSDYIEKYLSDIDSYSSDQFNITDEDYDNKVKIKKFKHNNTPKKTPIYSNPPSILFDAVLTFQLPDKNHAKVISSDGKAIIDCLPSDNSIKEFSSSPYSVVHFPRPRLILTKTILGCRNDVWMIKIDQKYIGMIKMIKDRHDKLIKLFLHKSNFIIENPSQSCYSGDEFSCKMYFWWKEGTKTLYDISRKNSSKETRENPKEIERNDFKLNTVYLSKQKAMFYLKDRLNKNKKTSISDLRRKMHIGWRKAKELLSEFETLHPNNYKKIENFNNNRNKKKSDYFDRNMDDISKEFAKKYSLQVPNIINVFVEKLDLPLDARIILIFGPNGSGKSRSIIKFHQITSYIWKPGFAIASSKHFDSAKNAFDLIIDSGITSFKDLFMEFDALSLGSQTKAKLAIAYKRYKKNKKMIVIDDFMEHVDKEVAKSVAYLIAKRIRENKNLGIILSTNKEYLIPYLQPDIVYSLKKGFKIEGVKNNEYGVNTCKNVGPIIFVRINLSEFSDNIKEKEKITNNNSLEEELSFFLAHSKKYKPDLPDVFKLSELESKLYKTNEEILSHLAYLKSNGMEISVEAIKLIGVGSKRAKKLLEKFNDHPNSYQPSSALFSLYNNDITNSSDCNVRLILDNPSSNTTFNKIKISKILDLKKFPVFKNNIQIVSDKITNKIEFICHKSSDEINGFILPNIPSGIINEEFALGVISGSNGSGKTMFIKKYFGEENNDKTCTDIWKPETSIISQFGNFDDISEKLDVLGLKKETLLLSDEFLSESEKNLVNILKGLGKDCQIIDNFCDYVDENRSKIISKNLSIYINKYKLKRVVIALRNESLISSNMLRPSWLINLDEMNMKFFDYKSKDEKNDDYEKFPTDYTNKIKLSPPKFLITIHRCSRRAWRYFKRLYYVNDLHISTTSKSFIIILHEETEQFPKIIGITTSEIDNQSEDASTMIEYRTSILPEYNKYGISSKVIDSVAFLFHLEGFEYISKTNNINIMKDRTHSPLWVKVEEENNKNFEDITNSVLFIHDNVYKKPITYKFVGVKDDKCRDYFRKRIILEE